MSRSNTTKCTAAAGAVAALLALSAVATPFPSFFTAFKNMFPNSLSGDNAGAASNCMLCHTPNGNDTWNGFGWQLRTSIVGGADIDTALMNAQPFDSDMDPTGWSNLFEINTSTQPGWTAGPNNTLYFEDGSTLGGQMPPGGIAGDLDHPGGLAGSYCISNPNSGGGAALISGSGSPVVADQDLTLTTMPVPSSVFGIHYYGPNQTSQAFGNGVRCVGVLPGVPTQRLPLVQAVGNVLTSVVDFGTPQAAGIVAGATMNFQGWFRDPLDPNGFQLSNGLAILFQ